MTREEKVLQLKQDFDEVYEAGKQAECDAFWDNLFDSVEWGSYNYFFAGTYWNDTTFKPNRDIVAGAGYTCLEMFRNNRVTNIAETLEKQGVVLDVSGAGGWTNMFNAASTIRLPLLDFSSVKNYQLQLNSVFSGCTQLETIDKLIVTKELSYSNAFYNCNNLVNLLIEGVIGKSGLNLQWSTKLSKASIESIINHLDLTEGRPTTSITLSLTAVNNAFEGGADGDEFNDLCASARAFGNWTISLV